MRRLLFVLIVLVLAPAAAAAQGPADVAVGSKKFTESVVLGEVAARVVDAENGPALHREQLGGTRVLWSALERGDIDAYPEYTGTIEQEILGGESFESSAALRRELEGRGIGMTEPLGFNNTYALGMRRSRAEELDIETISDLREHPDLSFGFTNEFLDREDGWPGLRERYELAPQNVRGLDHDLAYQGLESGEIDVIDLYSTDAEIEYYDIEVLEDNRSYFPRYEAVFVYRKQLEDTHPAAIAALEMLEGRIDERRMTALNAAVKIDGRSEKRVAADFLEEEFGTVSTVDEESRLERVWQRTKEHLFMVFISMLGAVLLAIPLGIWAARRSVEGQFILGGVGILQTIPSLALLVFMIPLLGIGTWPAIAALFLYSLLPIVRNTHAGLTDIDSEVIDSARALGMSASARLRLVELPLAARPILAGIKTSAVINIGTATLGALIGAGGYGQPILTGIRLDDMGLILEGAVPAAGLALLVQGVFELFEKRVVKW
ncbi:MAG: glycine betaine ABC transporter substrate-binding protein [Myxococcota bacterium]